MNTTTTANIFWTLVLTGASCQVAAQRPNRPLFPMHTYPLMEYVAIEFAEAFDMPEEFQGESYAGITVNAQGNLVVLSRGRIPLLEFDGNGRFLRSFGTAGMFNRAHGLHIDADDTIWITDVSDHLVYKLDRNGNVLMTIGTRGESSLFDEPNDVALDSNGNIYVAQGHTRGEPAILKFSPDGRFVTKWGSRGYGQAQFAAAHAIAIDADDTVYVADRENMRIQRFDTEGNFLGTWTFDAMVCAMHLHTDGYLYITTGFDGQFARVDMNNGAVLGAIGGPGDGNGQFVEAHSLAVDDEGNAYVTDVIRRRIQKFARH